MSRVAGGGWGWGCGWGCGVGGETEETAASSSSSSAAKAGEDLFLQLSLSHTQKKHPLDDNSLKLKTPASHALSAGRVTSASTRRGE